MQLRPIRVEGRGEEPGPERLELCDRTRVSGSCRGGNGCRIEHRHDRPRCSPPPLPRRGVALFQRHSELSPDLLKDGFNCWDRPPDGVHPVFIRGERSENIAL